MVRVEKDPLMTIPGSSVATALAIFLKQSSNEQMLSFSGPAKAQQEIVPLLSQ